MSSSSTTQHKNFSLWPYAIIATFVLFAGYIGFMVKQAMSTTVDLVSKDYYEKELAYQQHINTVSRTAQLSEAVAINFDGITEQITIKLPPEMAGKDVQGSILFFRPSDLNLDFQLPLSLNQNREQILSTAKLLPGFWKVRLSFTSNGQEYFKEQRIVVK